jgi:hypothetical protein
MVSNLDRVVLSFIAILLLAPMLLTFWRIASFDVEMEQARVPDVQRKLEAIHEEEARKSQISGGADASQPSLQQRTEKVLAWAPVWPRLGRFGALAIHRRVAWVGLFSILLVSGSLGICIWIPKLVR